MLHVLAALTHSLGHRTHAVTLRRTLADVDGLDYEALWPGENRTLDSRVLYRMIAARVPSSRVARANLDLRHSRTELATSMLARRALGTRLETRRAAGVPTDVLHIHTQALGYAGLPDMPSVVSADRTLLQALETGELSALPWTLRPGIAWERRVFRSATRSVFWSEWARSSAVRHYGLDLSSTAVVAPGVDMGAFNGISCRRTGNEPGARPRILFVGAAFERKGGPDLLRSFADALAGRAFLDIVTPHARHGLYGADAEGVRFYTDIRAHTPEWRALYAGADIFALPSRVEPFGLAFVEAMAAGLPVVAADVCAVREIVRDGETGLVVPPCDPAALARALVRLLEDKSLREALGMAGRERARTSFNASVQAERLAGVFDQALRAYG